MAVLDLPTVVYHDGEHYVAQCLDVDLSSFGANENEALASLGEAVELYLEDTPAPELEISRIADVEIRTLRVQRA